MSNQVSVAEIKKTIGCLPFESGYVNHPGDTVPSSDAEKFKPFSQLLMPAGSKLVMLNLPYALLFSSSQIKPNLDAFDTLAGRVVFQEAKNSSHPPAVLLGAALEPKRSL